MKKQVSTKTLSKGIVMSVAAQAVSLLVSLLLNLIIPKFFDGYQYAYWQTFLLYTSYSGILHFGLLDGIVLRYARYDYEELDKPKIRSQFAVLLLINSLISFGGILIALFFLKGVTLTIVVMISLGIITKNVFTYTSYSFQITNRIGKYAVLVIAQRLFFGVGVGALLIFEVKDFAYLCAVDLLADVFGILLGSFFNRGLYFGKLLPVREILEETKTNISAGVLLLISNWSSNLLIGGAKMIIQWHWDELVFGKVSFAFNVSNIFLTFVTAISVVLFPALKRMDDAEMPSFYQKTRNEAVPLLFGAMVFYFPGCYLLNLWLPNYSEGLSYLGIFLPLVVFTAIANLLTNNYLKAYREEKKMMVINLISIAVGLALYLAGAFLFNSLLFIFCAVLFTVMLRSVLSEICIMKIIKADFTGCFIVEALMALAFVLCARFFKLWVGGLIYLALFIVCFIAHWLKRMKRNREEKN